jgi:hypothetical protein
MRSGPLDQTPPASRGYETASQISGDGALDRDRQGGVGIRIEDVRLPKMAYPTD